MIESLARRLKLEPHELRQALVLGTVLFCITSSYTLVKTARDSLYLSQLPAQTLPYVYLGVGLLTLVTAHGFTRLTVRLPVWITLAVTAGLSVAGLVAFASFFTIHATWVPVAFYLWVNLYGLLLISQFWTFTASISNPQLAKKIFAPIGGGGIVGGLIGGLVSSAIGRTAGLTVLVMIAAVLVLAVVPLIIAGVRSGHAPPGDPPGKTDEKPRAWRSKYVRWLALATLCSVVVTGLLDYQLKVEIQSRYPSREALAHVFGLFYTAVNLGALLVQVLFTRWSMQRLGASNSALILPLGLGIGAAATLAAPGFRVVIATRLWDLIIRLSLNKSSVEMFYLPLEPALRRHAKAIIEAGLERLGDGLAAILILSAALTFGVDTWTLAWMVAGLVAIWLVAWYQLRGAYARELGLNLRRMSLGPPDASVSLRERALLKETVRLLDSPYERVVLQGMDLLEENAMRLLENRLPRLLEHRSSKVRGRALALIAARQTDEARDLVRKLLNDPDPTVRVQALQAHCALGAGSSTRALEEFFDAEDPGVRIAALRCLVLTAPPGEEPRVREVLERRLREGTSAERAEAVEAIGFREGPTALHDLLPTLFEDPDPEVRRAALRTAGRVPGREHVTQLIAALGKPDTERAARAGLTIMGEKVVGTLGDHLIDPDVTIEVRRAIPAVLAGIPSPESAQALMRVRESRDSVLGYRILKACNRIRSDEPSISFPADRVREDIEKDIRAYLLAFLSLGVCHDGEPRSAERFLAVVLGERLKQALDRICRRLALVYPPKNMLAAYRGLVSGRPAMRGNALEYIETALTVEDRDLVLPLLDESKSEALTLLAESRYGLSCHDCNDALRMLLGGDDPWLRVCALYVVGRRRERALEEFIAPNLEAEDPRVRETAGWAQAALATG